MVRSLLIVDDDVDQIKVLTHWFTRCGYQVVSASHPRQALVAARSEQFQVTIVDGSLPDMDGFELMRRLKRAQSNLQVIILSGYDYLGYRAQADGPFACLVKPCSLKLLESTVEHAFERAMDESLEEPCDLRRHGDEVGVLASCDSGGDMPAQQGEFTACTPNVQMI